MGVLKKKRPRARHAPLQIILDFDRIKCSSARSTVIVNTGKPTGLFNERVPSGGTEDLVR